MDGVQRRSELVEMFHHRRCEGMVWSIGEELLQDTKLGVFWFPLQVSGYLGLFEKGMAF